MKDRKLLDINHSALQNDLKLGQEENPGNRRKRWGCTNTVPGRKMQDIITQWIMADPQGLKLTAGMADKPVQNIIKRKAGSVQSESRWN